MAKPYFPFAHFCLGHFAPWFLPAAGACLIYQGTGGPESIDWSAPVATVSRDDGVAKVALPLAAGQVYALGVRAMAPSGTIDLSTHVYCLVLVDDSGNLRPLLARPSDLSADYRSDGTILVQFSYQSPSTAGGATCFGLFADDGNGDINTAAAVQIVPAAEGVSEYAAKLRLSRPPTLLAVRAVADADAGPLSTVAVRTVPHLVSPVLA
jgi:hypothetical protein